MLRKFVFLGIALLLSVYYFIPSKNMDKEIMSLLLFLVGVSTFLFFSRKEKVSSLDGQFFKHSNFAVLGLLIVNFQYYLDYVLGNVSDTNTFIFVNPTIVVKTLVLSFIGLLLFFVGYLSYNEKKRYITRKETIFNTKYLEWLVFVFLVLYFSTINISYIMGGYNRVDKGIGVAYIELLLNVFIIAVIIQKARNLILIGHRGIGLKDYISNLGIIINGSLFLYLFAVILSGDRGPFIIMSLIVFAGYLFVTKRKIKKRYGLLLLLVGASLITLLGIARNFDSDFSFTEKVQMALQESPHNTKESFLPQTKELAGSVKATHHAVDFVPQQHDFLWGRFQFQQLITIVPFFSIFKSLIFEDVSEKYSSSATYVTWIFQGDYPTYGNGTSVIADFYFDFGLLGVVVGMFMFGYCIRIAEIKMYSNELPELFATVFFMVYIGTALYISRSSFLFELKTVVWVYVVLLINKYVFNKKKSYE